MTTTQLVTGLGGAIGSSYVQATNQLFFVEFDGKVSVFDLVPQLETTVFTGTAVMPPDSSLNLSDGTSAQGGQIRWDHTSPDGQRVMRPQGNCELSYVGVANYPALDYSSLLNLPYSQASLDGEGIGNQLVPGAVFAVFNRSLQPAANFHYAKVQVLAAGPSLTIRWVSWRLRPRYRVLGTGYSQPEDIVVAADGGHAFVTERAGNLLRVNLASANRASAAVVASGMVAPQQMAIDEAHSRAYVVEFNAATSRLWRVDLATGAKTAVVSTLNGAVGLLTTGDMSVAYVGQQGGPSSIARVVLATGHVEPLPVTLTQPFFMTWAGPGESGILITERGPAQRVTLLDLTATPITNTVVSSVPSPQPSSVAVLSAERLVVCCNDALVEVNLTGSVFTGTGPTLLGIGHVPKTKIDADGYATTDAGYFFQVTHAPFGGTLPVMVNHDKIRALGGQFYRIAVDGIPQDQPWSDYLWSSSQNEFVLTTVPRVGAFFRVHAATELWYNHWLGYLLGTGGLTDGLHTLSVQVFTGTPGSEVIAGRDSVRVMVDNQLPTAEIRQVIRHDPANPDPALQHQVVNACAIVQGTSDEFSFVVQAEDPVGHHLLSWSLAAYWGDNRSASITGDSYLPGHLDPTGPTHEWAGVNGEVPSPHWHATVAGDPSSRRCAHTFSLTVWDRVIDGWNHIHRSTYNKSITLLLD